MNIDVHCHIYPQEYFDIVEKEGPRYGVTLYTDEKGARRVNIKGDTHPPLEPFVNVELRMETMRRMGLDMNVLSFSSNPGMYWADPALAEELCQASNDAYAEIIRKNPGKFSGLAAIPAHDAARSVRELERAVGKLGLKGGFMGSNVNGRYLDDEGFFPIYEAAAAMKVPIIVHPANPAGKAQMKDYHLFNIVGFTAESANSIGRLIFSGMFDRLPDLQFIFLHGGGTVPYLIGRYDHAWRVRPECKKIKRPPLEYLRAHFHFDCLVFHAPVVRFLVEIMGAGRVLLGTDLPYDMTDQDIVKTIQGAGLSPDDYAKVTHRNAQALFHL